MSISIQNTFQPTIKPFNQVSALVKNHQGPALPSNHTIQNDQLHLTAPTQLFQSKFQIPASAIQLPTLRPLKLTEVKTQIDLNQSSPREQIMRLGQKYGVAYDGSDLKKYQTKVIKTILKAKAQEYGIPEAIALGMAGNESGWKMWKNMDSGALIEGRNQREGKLLSTDWGVMQINDKAHPRAFPRAKQDLEYNIEYGLSYLARQRQKTQGNLGLGFGDWDRTIASYNLGHNPSTERAYQIAQNYVSHVKARSV